MVRIKQCKVYKFEELTEQAQDKAIERFADINVDYEWWDSTYADAAHIGLKLLEFDLDRNRHAKGNFTESAENVANKIIADHGNACETFKDATNYLAELAELTAKHKAADDSDDDDYSDDDLDTEEIDSEFEKTIIEDYSIILQNEYEYQTSREQIIETIKANEYEFDENGKLA